MIPSREGEGKRAKIAGLRFRLEEADTRFSHLMNKAEVSRFEIMAKGEV